MSAAQHMNNRTAKRPQEPQSVAQPFSLQAEHAIIGAVLHDPRVILEELADSINDDYFYDPFCRAAFKRAVAMAKDQQTVDMVLLSARMDGLGEMSELDIRGQLEEIYLANPNRVNLKGWCKIVHERWVDRQIAAAGTQMLQTAHVQDMTAEEKLANAHLWLSQIGSIMAEDTIVPTVEMVGATLAEVEENSKLGGQISGVPTGLTELDEMTTGFKGGDLIIVAARPSMGKTSLALSLGKHVSYELAPEKRKRVLLFTMEMGKTQIGMRWLSVLYNVPLHNLRTGSLSPLEGGRLQSAMEDAASAKFLLEESGTLTMEQLAAKARRAHREEELGMIVIDYLQLISDSGNKNATKSDRVGEISRALKQLARELNVPIMALSQLNRSLESRQDKRPMMSDLRDSGAIEQDADIILFLYRDWIYNKNTQDPDEAELILAKQRNGSTGTVKVRFDKSTTKFHDGPK